MRVGCNESERGVDERERGSNRREGERCEVKKENDEMMCVIEQVRVSKTQINIILMAHLSTTHVMYNFSNPCMPLVWTRVIRLTKPRQPTARSHSSSFEIIRVVYTVLDITDLLQFQIELCMWSHVRRNEYYLKIGK